MLGMDERRKQMKAFRESGLIGTPAYGRFLYSAFGVAAVFGVAGVGGNIYWSGTGYTVNVIASWACVSIAAILLGLSLNGLRLHLREKRKKV
jgi:hypothetical protein